MDILQFIIKAVSRGRTVVLKDFALKLVHGKMRQKMRGEETRTWKKEVRACESPPRAQTAPSKHTAEPRSSDYGSKSGHCGS